MLVFFVLVQRGRYRLLGRGGKAGWAAGKAKGRFVFHMSCQLICAPCMQKANRNGGIEHTKVLNQLNLIWGQGCRFEGVSKFTEVVGGSGICFGVTVLSQSKSIVNHMFLIPRAGA